MTLEFQKELFKFILQDKKEGSKHIKLLEPSIFSQSEYQVLFDLAKKYFEKYKVLPSKASFLEFFDRSSKTLDLEKRILERLDKAIRELYVPFDLDSGIVKETIIEFAQYQKTKELFTKYASKLSEGQNVFKEIQKEMNKIMSIGAEDNVMNSIVRGGSILEDAPPSVKKIVRPCYLKGVNRTTSAGGFYTPQLIILMAAPKGFKTGNLIKMAIEYVKTGLKVYYVDMENGVDSIRHRGIQAFLECTRQDLEETETLKAYRGLREQIKLFGGDLIHDYYPSKGKSVLDVEAELDKLRDEHGWEPDMIFWDYPDLMKPVDPNIKDHRLKPTAVYEDIIKLNVRKNVISFGLSQVNRAALEKEVFTIADFAEDFGKAATAHAAFAICATPREKMAHLARIVPVMQREGQEYDGENFTIVEIDHATMSVTPVTLEYATEKLKGIPQPTTKTKGKRRNYPDKDVDDN